MGWWGAGENKREKRKGLFVAAGGYASNDADNSGGNDQPERNKNRGDQIWSGGWHERREDDEGDAQDGD